MAGNLGDKGSRLLNRNCGFAISQPSSAPCAERAIAMLIILVHGEAGCDSCLQRNLAQKARQSWTENLNLSLTSTMNELLIAPIFRSAGFGPFVSAPESDMSEAWCGNADAGRMTSRERMFRRAAATVLPALVALATVPARATDCAFEPQGEGHVIDARSFRLSDGREIRLAESRPNR